jgi:hypothetical protein
MFILRRTTVFLGIAAEPVKAGCSLFCVRLGIASRHW